MIPHTINYNNDCPLQNQGYVATTMLVRQVAPAASNFGQSNIYVATLSADTPETFAQGMREIQEGHAVDFDTAVNEPPPAE